jgi:PAS domain S-box-containing protein
MKDSLEQRVKERTHDLVMTNRELISEIDRRKKAEEDLHKFFWAVQQNPVMISLANAEGIIEFVNPRFSEITGYLFKEAIGKNLHFLRTIDESHDTFPEIWQTVSSGGIWSGEHTNRKKNGEVYWVSTLISPIINQEGIVSHYLAVQEDITLKKEAVRQTIIAKEKAEESDRLKTTILANMSHEFRTPLIGILGFAQILLEEIIDESQADLVGEIEKSGNRLMRTLDSILFLSQLESGNIHESSTVLNPTDIVIRIYEQLTETAAAKGISFTINCMDEELHTKGVDEMLTMAFTHLIDNALKFTKAGSVEISISKRESEIGAQFVSVAVKDTGIGIPQEALELIFEPFRQYSEGYTRTYQGTGLGLTLARKIIELHGGHLEVSSMVGEGSVFTALLPIS